MRVADLCNTSLIINCICLSCVSQLFPNHSSSVTQVIIFLPSKMSLHGMSEYTFTVFTLFVAFNLLQYDKKVIVMTNLFAINTNYSYTTDTKDKTILNFFLTIVNYV